MTKWLLQALVTLAFLALMLTVILPWAGESMTRSAQGQFIQQASASTVPWPTALRLAGAPVGPSR